MKPGIYDAKLIGVEYVNGDYIATIKIDTDDTEIKLRYPFIKGYPDREEDLTGDKAVFLLVALIVISFVLGCGLLLATLLNG